MTVSDWTTCRRSTAGGIKYRLVEGPEIEHTEDGSTAREVYLMQASNVAAFIAESMPPPYVLGFFVILPDRRRMPGTAFFITKGVSAKPHLGQLPCDPFGADSGAPDGTYDSDMLVTINYAVTKEADTNRDQQKPETFLEHSLQAGGEFYSIGKDRLRYREDGDVGNGVVRDETAPAGYVAGSGRQMQEKNAPGAHLTVATLEHTLRWPFVLSPDWTTFFSCLGKVNSQSTILFHNAAEETVLFSSISGTQKYVWNGSSASVQPWSLDFKFSQRVLVDGTTDITWNHVYSPNAVGGPKWIKPFWLPDATDSSTKRYLYDAADLYAMFKTST